MFLKNFVIYLISFVIILVISSLVLGIFQENKLSSELSYEIQYMKYMIVNRQVRELIELLKSVNLL